MHASNQTSAITSQNKGNGTRHLVVEAPSKISRAEYRVPTLTSAITSMLPVNPSKCHVKQVLSKIHKVNGDAFQPAVAIMSPPQHKRIKRHVKQGHTIQTLGQHKPVIASMRRQGTLSI
jgi:hypothetical protein